MIITSTPAAPSVHIQGLECVGSIQNPMVNGGAHVPLFAPATPTDGSPSINTLEGWNALANRHKKTVLSVTSTKDGKAEL